MVEQTKVEPIFDVGSTPKKTVARISLAFDAGASDIKIIYRVGRRRSKAKYINFASLIRRTDRLTEGDNVVYGDAQKQIYEIGKFSQGTTFNIRKLKAETMLPKILFGIGKIAEKEGLFEKPLEIVLSCLLPIGEIEDSDFIEEEIAKVDNFVYKDKTIEVKFKETQFYPEGTGIKAGFDIESGLILMLGHRNASAIIVEEGRISRYKSSSNYLGFHQALERIVIKASGIETDALIKTITTKTEKGVNGEGKSEVVGFKSQFDVEKAIVSSNEKLRNRERQRLKSAIAESLKEYQDQIGNWLEEKSFISSSQLDSIALCGGSCCFIEDGLKQYFSEYREIFSSTEIAKEIVNTLEFDSDRQKEKFIAKGMAVRLTDCWGLFAHLYA